MGQPKNIYLVQANDRFSGGEDAVFLPYAIGAIAAQAFSNEGIRQAFRLQRIIFLREPADCVAASLSAPYLIGFSCYIWNHEYNKAVAQKVKAIYPDCLIVFGGHNIPDDTSLLAECPYIDILVHGEGEEIFEKLLSALIFGGEFDKVPNISYRDPERGLLKTYKEIPLGCDYPSPYTAGIFDDIIHDHSDIRFSAILETNRGCPYHCAFCDWGPLSTKAKMFPEARVKDDIKWFSEHEIDYIWGADANFGLFKRDSLIADWLIEAKKRTGYPARIKVNYAKHNTRTVFHLAKRFADADLSKSTTVSFQTMSDTVLANIGRSNMSLEYFSELIRLYRSSNIPTYSELILALPGETYESFIDGLDKLLDAGQHSVIEIYDCVLLPNSILAAKRYREIHGIKTVCVPFILYHCETMAEEIVEYSEIVISTSTLSPEDWVRCKLYAIAVQSMQCLGLLRCVSIYLHNELNVAYSDFYQGLLRWFFKNPGTLGFEIFTDIRRRLEKIRAGDNLQYFHNEEYGDVLWYLDEGVFIRTVEQLDRFYSETAGYLEQFGIHGTIYKQLTAYQAAVIRIPGRDSFELRQDYDFYNYFLLNLNSEHFPLAQYGHTLRFSASEKFSSLAEYAREVVWYGRRLGKTVCTGEPADIQITRE